MPPARSSSLLLLTLALLSPFHNTLAFSPLLPPPPSYSPRATTSTTSLNLFDNLSSSLSKVFNNLPTTTRKLTPSNIKPALDDIKAALLDADVAQTVTNDLLNKVSNSTVGAKVAEGIRPDQLFIKIFYDELVTLMGGDPKSSEVRKRF